jgi:hypothetical protein
MMLLNIDYVDTQVEVIFLVFLVYPEISRVFKVFLLLAHYL